MFVGLQLVEVTPRRGDTDKQKDSASKAFCIENHEYFMLVPSLLELMHGESLVIYLLQGGLFVYRYLPIDEKINIPLCVL